MKVNKAQAIRRMFEIHGREMKPRLIMKMLAEKGIIVSAQQVSNERYRAENVKGIVNETVILLPELQAAKHFIHQCGGLEKAKRVLDAYLEMIQS